MKLKHKSLFCVVAASLGSVSIASAQPAETRGLEEIVVTAQKRAQSMQDVPVAITSADEMVLSATGVEAQVSLPMITPNLQFQGLVQYVSPYLRGIGTSFANPGLEGSVAVYLDDRYISRTSSGIFQFSDVERVEVLKGPQGTLYGRNSSGGAIRIITKEPTRELEAGLSTTLGNYDRRDVAGYLSGPLTDTLSGRIAVNINNRDGYVDRTSPELPELEDRDEQVAMAKLNWEPTDRLTVKLSGTYADKDDYHGTGYVTAVDGPYQLGLGLGADASPDFYTAMGERPTANDDHKYHNRDYGGSLRVDYDLDTATLSSITTYTKLELKTGITDIDSTALNLIDFYQTQWTETFSQEFQAVSNSDSKLQWVTGVYVLREKAHFDGGVYGDTVIPTPGPTETLFSSEGEVVVDSVAPYADFTYEFNELFELIMGVRYTIESKELTKNQVYLQPFDPDAGLPIPGSSRTTILEANQDSTTFNALTPRLVLNYRPADNLMFYLSYSEGFKSGGYNLPAFSQPSSVQPEDLTSYEFGWKTEFGNLRLNGAAFFYNFKDIQVGFTDTSAGGSQFQNAEAEIKGLEMELLWQPVDNLEIGAGAGFLDAEFTKFNGGSAFGPRRGGVFVPGSPRSPTDNGVVNPGESVPAHPSCQADPGNPAVCGGIYPIGLNLKGNALPYTADWTGHLRAQYTMDMGAAGRLVPSVIVSYTDSYFHDNGNVLEEDGYALVNATLSWNSQDDRYGISVFGTNLTDQEHRTTWSFDNTGGWQIPAPPRMYGVKFSYNFMQ